MSKDYDLQIQLSSEVSDEMLQNLTTEFETLLKRSHLNPSKSRGETKACTRGEPIIIGLIVLKTITGPAIGLCLQQAVGWLSRKRRSNQDINMLFEYKKQIDDNTEIKISINSRDLSSTQILIENLLNLLEAEVDR